MAKLEIRKTVSISDEIQFQQCKSSKFCDSLCKQPLCGNDVKTLQQLTEITDMICDLSIK